MKDKQLNLVYDKICPSCKKGQPLTKKNNSKTIDCRPLTTYQIICINCNHVSPVRMSEKIAIESFINGDELNVK